MKVPPTILTIHAHPDEMKPFDLLRQQHFPPDKNFLSAHITAFHHLPGQHLEAVKTLASLALCDRDQPVAMVSGVQHLGAGVAFKIESDDLSDLRADLKKRFGSWLGPQDRQKWQPHITIQNKVARQKADFLYWELKQQFEPTPLRITGVDIWSYLGGPWRHETLLSFKK